MPRIDAALTIPTLLAVTALAVTPSCGDEEANDEAADSGSASASESGGDDECVDIEEETMCDAAEICAWDGVCHIHCPKIADQATCEMQGFLCYWPEDRCEYGGV
jgi:hypothetical protein